MYLYPEKTLKMINQINQMNIPIKKFIQYPIRRTYHTMNLEKRFELWIEDIGSMMERVLDLINREPHKNVYEQILEFLEEQELGSLEEAIWDYYIEELNDLLWEFEFEEYEYLDYLEW